MFDVQQPGKNSFIKCSTVCDLSDSIRAMNSRKILKKLIIISKMSGHRNPPNDRCSYICKHSSCKVLSFQQYADTNINYEVTHALAVCVSSLHIFFFFTQTITPENLIWIQHIRAHCTWHIQMLHINDKIASVAYFLNEKLLVFFSVSNPHSFIFTKYISKRYRRP